MNRSIYPLLLALCVLLTACQGQSSVTYSEEPTDIAGRSLYTISIQNPPRGTDWTMWFCMFRSDIELLPEQSDGELRFHGGTLYRIIPNTDTHGHALKVTYSAPTIQSECRAPEGFYIEQKNGKTTPVSVSYSFEQVESKAIDWSYEDLETGLYDMVPRPKSVTLSEGCSYADVRTVNRSKVEEEHPNGWYRIDIANDTISLKYADEDGAQYAEQTLNNLFYYSHLHGGVDFQNGTIEDWPDMSYRGLMLDVSRNFTSKDDLMTLIDILSHYKVNYLHLHMGDDEGWRVAIDALPELTSFGAHRVLPEINEDGDIVETQGLKPTYSGTSGRDDLAAPGNGYYSHEDYVDILKYAWERRIRIIPEFDIPGHSRAAIRSMEYRAATTGDTSYRLIEDGETSVYESAQDFTDCVINIALPSTYHFIETVFDALIALHREAGVPLDAIHIGGDEVPGGAWEGSPACVTLMKEHGWDTRGLKDYFTGKVIDIAISKGVKLAGWQELAMHLSGQTLERLKDNLLFVNFWAWAQDELFYTLANQCVNVVTSHSTNYYLDMMYNTSRSERGLCWAGVVDERRSFSLLPYDIYKSVRWDNYGHATNIAAASEGKVALTDEGRKHIIGVQGQLWAETIRSFDDVTYCILPKGLGVFERGWNATPAWSESTQADDELFQADFNRFYSTIVDNEYPYYDMLELKYHKGASATTTRQP